MKPLVLGLGNDLIGDDGVGLRAIELLRDRHRDEADITGTSLHGVALLDLFIDRRQVIVIDAVKTGRHPPGTVLEFEVDKLRAMRSPSPHYSGLPELLALASEIGLEFPREIRIFAVEIAEPLRIEEGLSGPVAASLTEILERVTSQLREWAKADSRVLDTKGSRQDA